MKRYKSIFAILLLFSLFLTVGSKVDVVYSVKAFEPMVNYEDTGLSYNKANSQNGFVSVEDGNKDNQNLVSLAFSKNKGTITYQNNNGLLVITVVGVIAICFLALFLYVMYNRENSNNPPRRYSDTAVTIDARPFRTKSYNILQKPDNTKVAIPEIKLPAMQPKVNNGTIIIETGSLAGYELSICEGEELIFGKDSARCNVIFSDDYLYISRLHCSVLFNKGNYYITDYSSNGVFCGEFQLEKNKTIPIASGTRIYLASKAYSLMLK